MTWKAPIDWMDGGPLRARNLNQELGDNVAWLKDRPTHIISIYGQAAELTRSNTVWSALPTNYRLELVLPDVCNVLLRAQFTVLGTTAHQLWWDWVRDGNYWLSSADGSKPANSGDGMSELLSHTTQDEHVDIFWWDVGVTPGRHTWDLAFINASSSFVIEQVDTVWQLSAIGW